MKGGGGKSLMSSNIGMGLARSNKKIAMIDVDIDSPNLPEIMNLSDKEMSLDKEDNFVPVKWGPRIWLWSMGIFYAKGDKTLVKYGESIRQIINDAVKYTTWPDNIDLVIVDLPAGSSDETKSVLKYFDNIIGASVVSQPSTLSDLERAISICDHYSLPILGVVENMAYVECKCGERITPFRFINDDKTVEDICKERDVTFAGQIPLVSLERGKPRLPKDQEGAITTIIKVILDELDGDK